MSDFVQSLKSSIYSAATWTGELPSHLRNELYTLGDVAQKVPGAIWNELHDDVKTGWKEHPGRAVAMGVSAVVGAAALVLTRRAPAIMGSFAESGILKGMAITGATAEGALALSGTVSLLSDGWRAETAAKREVIAKAYSHSIGDNLAPILETTIAGGAGAFAADRALAVSPRLNVASFKFLTENRDYNYNYKFMTREKLFAGAGSFDLAPEVAVGANRVNMNLLTQQLDNAPTTRLNRAFFHGDSNVEVLRAVDLGDLRVSKPMRGTPWGSRSAVIPEGLTYHNHHPLIGVQAGVDDAAYGTGLNIVKSGGYRGYYVGQKENLDLTGKNLSEIVSGGNRPALNQLVINDEGQRAFLLQRQLKLDETRGTWKWDDTKPKYVSYDAAKSLLDNIDPSSTGAARAFETLPKISAPVHPDDQRMTSFFTTASAAERKLKLAGTR